MEENQNTEVPSEVATPSEVPSCPEVSEESCASQPEVKQHARKNGRNRSCKRGAKQASAEAESCGELENPAEFHEKLSGSNVSGYAENDRQKRERIRKLSREELELYDEDIKNMRDIYATRKFDEKKGMEIGMAKGMAKGMEKEKLATARRLLSMGLSDEQVSTATELPLEDIQKMKE